MSEFKPGSSGLGSDDSVNVATTTSVTGCAIFVTLLVAIFLCSAIFSPNLLVFFAATGDITNAVNKADGMGQ